MSDRNLLLLIDPQGSFAKRVPANSQQKEHDGELFVEGGDKAMEAVGKFVNRSGKMLDKIRGTLDSHHIWHCSVQLYYAQGEKIPLFSQIKVADNPPDRVNIFENYRYDKNGQPEHIQYVTTRMSNVKEIHKKYLELLHKKNRYPHTIWPTHCVIGTPGHNVVPQVMEHLFNWEIEQRKSVEWNTKGSNFHREHFSGLRAEVTDSLWDQEQPDPSIQINTKLVEALLTFDKIFLAGLALSHCLANTVRDIAETFGKKGDKKNPFVEKCILLTDCTANVPGFEHFGTNFINEMADLGMKQAKSTDF